LSILLKLRDWLTVPEAAQHLSMLSGDAIGEAHVLRFALDGRLKLSVFFPKPTPALLGTIITVEDVLDHLPEGNPLDPEGLDPIIDATGTIISHGQAMAIA
jgi:hypothetical protein